MGAIHQKAAPIWLPCHKISTVRRRHGKRVTYTLASLEMNLYADKWVSKVVTVKFRSRVQEGLRGVTRRRGGGECTYDFTHVVGRVEGRCIDRCDEFCCKVGVGWKGSKQEWLSAQK